MPNALIIAALIISLVRHIDVQGFFGVYPWLTGTIVPFILTYLFYKLRMLGASDVKVFAVVGSFAGFPVCIKVMVLSVFFGAVLAIGKIIARKNLKCRLEYFIHYLHQWEQQKRPSRYYDRIRDGEDGIIPFTVAITLAAIFCLY